MKIRKRNSVISFILATILLLACTTTAFAAPVDNKDTSSLDVSLASTMLTATGDTSGFGAVSAVKTIHLNQKCKRFTVTAICSDGSYDTGRVVIEGFNGGDFNIAYNDGTIQVFTDTVLTAGTYDIQFFSNTPGKSHKASIVFYDN